MHVMQLLFKPHKQSEYHLARRAVYLSCCPGREDEEESSSICYTNPAPPATTIILCVCVSACMGAVMFSLSQQQQWYFVEIKLILSLKKHDTSPTKENTKKSESKFIICVQYGLVLQQTELLPKPHPHQFDWGSLVPRPHPRREGLVTSSCRGGWKLVISDAIAQLVLRE